MGYGNNASPLPDSTQLHTQQCNELLLLLCTHNNSLNAPTSLLGHVSMVTDCTCMHKMTNHITPLWLDIRAQKFDNTFTLTMMATVGIES